MSPAQAAIAVLAGLIAGAALLLIVEVLAAARAVEALYQTSLDAELAELLAREV